jgi:hypothetical protein
LKVLHTWQTGSNARFVLEAALASRILQFINLEPDWDSYGARPIASRAIISAVRLTSRAVSDLWPQAGDRLEPFAVVPSPDGGVQVEWRNANHHFEVEVRPTGRYDYLHEITGAAGDRKYEEKHRATLGQVIAKLASILIVNA